MNKAISLAGATLARNGVAVPSPTTQLLIILHSRMRMCTQPIGYICHVSAKGERLVVRASSRPIGQRHRPNYQVASHAEHISDGKRMRGHQQLQNQTVLIHGDVLCKLMICTSFCEQLDVRARLQNASWFLHKHASTTHTNQQVQNAVWIRSICPPFSSGLRVQ